MSRAGTLILLGMLIALLPFLGLPYSWLMVLEPLLGLSCVAMAISIRAQSGKQKVSETKNEMAETQSLYEEKTPIGA